MCESAAAPMTHLGGSGVGGSAEGAAKEGVPLAERTHRDAAGAAVQGLRGAGGVPSAQPKHAQRRVEPQARIDCLQRCCGLSCHPVDACASHHTERVNTLGHDA